MKLLRFAAVLVAVGLIAGQSLAAMMNHGNFSATNVTFVAVTENTNRITQAGAVDPGLLFNAPTTVGDSLDFNPTFSSIASGAGSTTFTDGQLNFTIDANANAVVQSIGFTEVGDTTLIGAGTDATQTWVALAVIAQVTEIDNVAVSGLPQITAMGAFNPSSGDFKLVTDGAGLKIWSGGVPTININGWLTANSIPFVNGATKVEVALNNQLYAASEAGTTAAIFKKDIDANTGVRIIINGGGDPEVPEPATVVLAGLAVVAGVVARRRLA